MPYSGKCPKVQRKYEQKVVALSRIMKFKGGS